MDKKEHKKDQEPKYLSEEFEPAPHIERDRTIISTFLEAGEKEDLEKRTSDEPKEFNQYKKPKTWMDYWEQREEIYRQKKKKQKIEIYEPEASEKLIALIGYFAFFVPILTGDNRKSGFVKFHMKQSINLLVTNMFVFVTFGVGILMLHVYMPEGVNNTFYAVLSAIWLLPIYLIAAGMSNASNGKWKRLPLVGKDILDD